MVGLVGIIYKANIKKMEEINVIASSALTRAEFEDYSNRATCNRKEVRADVTKLIEGQTKMAEAIARIEGKLEK